MFFVLIFLILSAATSYLFPEWSWVIVLLVSFSCVAMLRIVLSVTSRPATSTQKME